MTSYSRQVSRNFPITLVPRIGSFQGTAISNTSTKINDLKHQQNQSEEDTD